MRTLGGYLQQYWRDYAKPNQSVLWLPVLFIALLTAAEYGWGYEAALLQPFGSWWANWPLEWAYQMAIVLVPLWLVRRSLQQPNWGAIVTWLGAGMAIYAFRSVYKGHQSYMLSQNWDRPTLYFYWGVGNQLFQALSVVLPLWLLGKVSAGKLPAFHGLVRANLRPYGWLLLGAVPLVGVAAMQPDFQAYYPRFVRMAVDGVGLERWQIALFEASYALDFFATEYFFRGFLILAFVRLVGPAMILPVAIFYVSIHFGKPLGETISSFFGGMLLGIFAHYSKSIWGGIVLHIGLAWLMELAGSL